ncbi:hypothetical protein LB506_008962 [Fusarium annulatum]|nr:hypothetical protein LB506_008962 [Fusarium annulatum]
MRFYSSAQSLVFPLLSLRRFRTTTLPLAYSEGAGRKRHTISAKCSAYGVLIMSDIFGLDSGDEMADISCWCQRYALEIEASIPTILREMRVDGVESLLMLMIFKYFMGDLESASFLVSMTSRFLIQLGAHLYPSSSGAYDKHNDSHHIRDLFWVCYCIDKDLSHRTGQPPTISDDHCDLTLPPNYVQMQSSNILSSSPCPSRSSSTVPLYPWDIRLSVIKSKIYNDLHSISAARLSETEILRRIRHLDEELEAWRVTLPSDHRPTLSFLEQTPVDANTNTQAIMLRLSYHHCVILIHQARCRVFQSNQPTDNLIDDGHRINFQILVDASKSILIYLEKALPVLAHECFWYVGHHFLSNDCNFDHLLRRASRQAIRPRERKTQTAARLYTLDQANTHQKAYSRGNIALGIYRGGRGGDEQISVSYLLSWTVKLSRAAKSRSHPNQPKAYRSRQK